MRNWCPPGKWVSVALMHAQTADCLSSPDGLTVLGVKHERLVAEAEASAARVLLKLCPVTRVLCHIADDLEYFLRHSLIFWALGGNADGHECIVRWHVRTPTLPLAR